jgi:ankyrin repeat protein
MPKEKVNEDHRQQFFEAVKANDSLTIRRLLEQDAELANARSEANISAVLLAAYHRHFELAKELGARKELDICEATAIGQIERVTELLEQNSALANEFSPDGFPVLSYAAFFGQPDALVLLLQAGADPNEQARNSMLIRPLHAATAQSDQQIALTITARLLAAGADANIKQQGGWTPLHAAAANGNLELIQLLLRHGADLAAKNDDSKTAFDLATEKQQAEAANLLASRS